MMFTDEVLWRQLTDRLADLAIASLRSQVEHGASALQLFDSWAGALHPDHYRRYVLPSTRRVMEGVADLGVPRIVFGVNTGELLGVLAETGADVVGVDWRTPLPAARERVPSGRALQGNLDPALVVAGLEPALAGTREVLAANGGHPAHVFNLGHGVLPETDPEVLEAVVETVHAEGVTTGPA
jgi:uroporphyrinogen decarboxylase